MPCVKRSLLALAVVALLTLFPKATFAVAGKTCECFCGSAGVGAVDADAMTNDACQQTCIDTNTQFVGCFSDPQYYPDRNPKCWTREQCEDWTGYSGVTLIGATWDTGPMPYDCAKTKSSNLEQHYCYPDAAPYTLNVQIGSVSTIASLPTYINTVYSWLLPAASLVAVVMMMLGGLQYVMSRGKSKYIEKAKTRITNAITGLVILLSIFVLVNLIDPRLTTLNELRIPMMKEVTLLDAMSSCERLSDADVGYDVSLVSGAASCGGTGQITSEDHLVSGAIGSWKLNDKCEYMTCVGADAGKSCVAEGETKVCKACGDIPNPTQATCNGLANTAKGADTQNYCEFWSSSGGGTCVAFGQSASASASINCNELKVHAKEAIGSSTTVKRGCSVYETLYAGFSYADAMTGNRTSVSSALNATYLKGTDSVTGDWLEKVCNDDLCEIAKEVGANRCTYNEGAVGGAQSMVATALKDWFGMDIVQTSGYFCHTF